MDREQIIEWLLKGDVSIQYQVFRDLYGIVKGDLQDRIEREGYGKAFLREQNADGHWGRKFYQPKWTSSHYTILDLKILGVRPDHPAIQKTIEKILKEEKTNDGGILAIGSEKKSDVCVNGMFLNYACYFMTDEYSLRSVVDYLLTEHMADGGFNCRSNRSGAVHSSLHSTLSVLEGIAEYRKNGYQYRLEELMMAQKAAIEFILIHRLFRSDRTGKVIHPEFLLLRFPHRWKYNILRALDYFQSIAWSWDDRMQDAMDVLVKKRNKDGTWNVQAQLPGQLHFEMEKAGQPSRWNTLRAFRVLKWIQEVTDASSFGHPFHSTR